MYVFRNLKPASVTFTAKEDKQQADLKPLYVRTVINSLGSGLVSQFMSVYAVELGALSSAMG
jgi:hypothetical protein